MQHRRDDYRHCAHPACLAARVDLQGREPLKMINECIHPDGRHERVNAPPRWKTASGDIHATSVDGFYDHHLVPLRDMPADGIEEDEARTEAPARAAA